MTNRYAIHTVRAYVAAIDYDRDVVVFVDNDGNVWEYWGADDWGIYSEVVLFVDVDDEIMDWDFA